ncbi:MAG: hypothetical protein WCK86_00970 [Planctomycetia bacterium]
MSLSGRIQVLEVRFMGMAKSPAGSGADVSETNDREFSAVFSEFSSEGSFLLSWVH